jgi:hypothetical protein
MGLLPDPHFPDAIRREIPRGTAANVIETPSLVKSRRLYGEAKLADAHGKPRMSELDPGPIPLPFNTGRGSAR